MAGLIPYSQLSQRKINKALPMNDERRIGSLVCKKVIARRLPIVVELN